MNLGRREHLYESRGILTLQSLQMMFVTSYNGHHHHQHHHHLPLVLNILAKYILRP